MDKIYLSNITDKVVINDLVKFIKASGVDLEDAAISKDKNWIQVMKSSESVYNLCIQSGSLWFDIRIHYGNSKSELVDLSVRISGVINEDLENWYGIRLINGDTLEHTTTIEKINSKVFPGENIKCPYNEKIGNLQASSIIDKIINRIKPFVTAYRNDTYIESSFVRACGVTTNDGMMVYLNNGAKMFAGEKDGCGFLLKYSRSGDKLQNFVIGIERRVSADTKVSYDIRSDIGDKLYLAARIIKEKFVSNGICGYSVDKKKSGIASLEAEKVIVNYASDYATELEPTTWEDLLVIVSDMVNKPLETLDKYAPTADEIGIPKIKLPIEEIKK